MSVETLFGSHASNAGSDMHVLACRFSGATPVASTSTPAAACKSDADAPGNAAAAPALTGELDSEITQLLRSLSKRDATTKSKALQAGMLQTTLCFGAQIAMKGMQRQPVCAAAEIEICGCFQRCCHSGCLFAGLGLRLQQAGHGQ